MAIARFIRDGLTDVDRRLAVSRLHEPDDAVATRMIESSHVYALVSGAVTWCNRVARGSALMNGARGAIATWQRSDRMRRHWVLGGTLASASCVHLVLSQWLGHPPGWLWLLVPVLALLAGALLMLPAALRGKDAAF